jgi:hypothetical protein
MIESIPEKPTQNPVDIPTVVVHPNDLQTHSRHTLWTGNLPKWIIPIALLVFIVLITIPALLRKWLWM